MANRCKETSVPYIAIKGIPKDDETICKVTERINAAVPPRSGTSASNKAASRITTSRRSARALRSSTRRIPATNARQSRQSAGRGGVSRAQRSLTVSDSSYPATRKTPPR